MKWYEKQLKGEPGSFQALGKHLKPSGLRDKMVCLKLPSFPRFPSCWVGRATLLGVSYFSEAVTKFFLLWQSHLFKNVMEILSRSSWLAFYYHYFLTPLCKSEEQPKALS